MTMLKILTGLGILAAICGCRTYQSERPPIDQLDKRDRELQSKDVVDASQEMAQQLLSLDVFKAPAPMQTIVVTDVANKTHRPNFNYDIFLMRLKGQIARVASDRIMIISPREQIEGLRSRELEGGPDDGGRGAPASIPPTWALHGTVADLPNKGTNYYYFDFKLSNLKTRQEIPITFEVRVAR